MDKEPRPDEVYLFGVIDHIERSTGEWDMADELAEPGGTVLENTVLHEISVSFLVKEGVPAQAVIALFAGASGEFVRIIDKEGYNVCRPLGIRDPSMQAKDGTIQLCKRGTKTSIYMAHRFDDGTTTVTLKMLVGVK